MFFRVRLLKIVSPLKLRAGQLTPKTQEEDIQLTEYPSIYMIKKGRKFFSDDGR